MAIDLIGLLASGWALVPLPFFTMYVCVVTFRFYPGLGRERGC